MKLNNILKDTLIVVPTYNESANLEKTIINLQKYFPNILIIDDGSTDNSTAFLDDFRHINLLTHSINLGQGKSLETGFIYFLSKGYKYIITFDSDGQHRTKDALGMIKYIYANDLDYLLGSRFLKNKKTYIPKLKKFILKLGVFFENYRSNLKLTDAHNGLRVLNRKAVKDILPIKCSKMAHASEIVKKLGKSKLNGCEFPVTIIYKNKKSQPPLNFLKILFEIYLNEYLR